MAKEAELGAFLMTYAAKVYPGASVERLPRAAYKDSKGQVGRVDPCMERGACSARRAGPAGPLSCPQRMCVQTCSASRPLRTRRC